MSCKHSFFFAYGTLDQLKHFVYDNVNLPFLRFYYRHTHVGSRIEKAPMIVPNHQMENLMIICDSVSDNIIFSKKTLRILRKGGLLE